MKRVLLFFVGSILLFSFGSSKLIGDKNFSDLSTGDFLFEPPVLYNVTPSIAGEGDTVLLTGKFLTGTTGVFFGDVDTPAHSFRVLSDTTVEVIVPQQGTNKLKISTSLGSTTMYNNFTHKGPNFTNATPIFGGTGSSHVLTGSNMSSVSEVKVSGVPVISFTILNPNQIRFIKNTAPSGPVSVKNPYGTTVAAYITDSDPRIDSIKPISGTQGDTIIAYGRFMYDPAAVTVGGTNVTKFWVIGPTYDNKVFFILGSGSSGTVTFSGPSGTRSFGDFIYFKKVLLCPGASIALPAGKTGSTYGWQVNKGNGFEAIGDTGIYSGTSTATLNLNAVPSTYYGYAYRCSIDGQYNDQQRIYFRNNWVGGSGNSWENPANWQCGSLPEANTDVFIPAGNITINSNVVCRSLRLATGATVTVAPGYNLTITN